METKKVLAAIDRHACDDTLLANVSAEQLNEGGVVSAVAVCCTCDELFAVCIIPIGGGVNASPLRSISPSPVSSHSGEMSGYLARIFILKVLQV